jgi:predicted nucleotidyltransferase
MLDKDQIAKLVDFAGAKHEISALYLFGSHASGHERSSSDIDLGVLFNEDIDGFARIDMETEISNILCKDVDLIDMKRSGPFLRHQIYKHGELIYHDETDFPFLFRAQSINEYLDTGYLRRLRRVYLNG